MKHCVEYLCAFDGCFRKANNKTERSGVQFHGLRPGRGVHDYECREHNEGWKYNNEEFMRNN